MLTIAILGASGYSGAELLRLLVRRADVAVTRVFAASSAGQRVDALYPAFAGTVDLTFEAFGERPLEGVDVAFLALPSGEAMNIVPGLLRQVPRVIDLGGDFRLLSPDLYARYYKHPHSAPELLGSAVYGLPEVNAAAIAASALVANPGCYPTSALLGVIPALKHPVISRDGIVINALSGVSGAGRSASQDLSFSEVNENIRAYKVGNHQHIPEIETVLASVAGGAVPVTFTPHLIPITRGIYSTITATVTVPITTQEMTSLYRAFYADAPFVRVRDTVPQIRDVAHTNYCDLMVSVDQRTKRLTVLSAIDNLVKGAAGQAIQNMNIMAGFPQEEGLQ